ncbi:MAG: polysaccharide biosynthesis protein [Brevinemataceae bacterium]
MFKDKTLVITGGTGSFGNQMLRYFLDHTEIKQVRVFSRDEEKQDKMRTELKDTRIKYYIGDIRNFESLDDAFKGSDFVFHAAALKQVPSCEFYPMEAVQTNIIGSNNVLNAAIKNNIKNLIMLSTDKAVEPLSTMGMTKAIMEKLMIAKSRTVDSSQITLCATRYGNVIGSRGSVIPLFIKQCKENIPMTVTNPNMTRFLMSLEESVDLVLFAFNHAKNGDIFIQKAPACTIGDLALAIRQLFNPNNEIKIIGERHGEKLHEHLIGPDELFKAEDLGQFFRIPKDERDLNYDKQTINRNCQFSENEKFNSSNTTQLDIDGIIQKLLELDYIQQELKN